jgi:tetratricopeptide (TPR) repeat protein
MNASKHNALHRLSVCMIVKNEAAMLGRCLESVSGCADEIIVVDTGSTDDSVSIAKSAGALVVESDWRDDFSYSRNISLRRASGNWLLWLDADDVVPSVSIPQINVLKQTPPDRVLGFVVKNEKPGSTGSEFMQARMFPNRPDIFFERRIHEQMMPSALRLGMKLEETDVVVEHHGYADPARVKDKADRNVRLLLDEWDPAAPDAVMAIEIADSYSMLGQWAEAERWYTAALAVPGCEAGQPDIASQAFLGIGNIRNRQEKYPEAAEYCGKALALCPGRADALFSLAVAQDMAGDLAAAADTLKKILAGGGGAVLKVGVDFREARIKAYLRLERILGDLKKNSEALAMAREAVQALPERPEILDMQGRLLLKNNMLMDALHAFEKSLQLNTQSNLEGYIGLCRIYTMGGRKETAVQTMAAVRGQFGKKPMYWAFWRMLTGEAGEPAPAEIDKKEIERETAALSKLYWMR